MRDAVGVLVRLGARVVSAEVGELGVRGEMGGLSYIVHALGERDASDVVWRGPRRGGSGQCTKYPHSEVESFHALLHQGHLADALPALVSVLHDTVPILEVLVHIPACAVPKAAGWWRAMFGPRGSTGGDAVPRGMRLTFTCSRARESWYSMCPSRSSAVCSHNRRMPSNLALERQWAFVRSLSLATRSQRLLWLGAGVGPLLVFRLVSCVVRRMPSSLVRRCGQASHDHAGMMTIW
jgi:hypothetical protein